jgi:hypothetical protein
LTWIWKHCWQEAVEAVWRQMQSSYLRLTVKLYVKRRFGVEMPNAFVLGLGVRADRAYRTCNINITRWNAGVYKTQ